MISAIRISNYTKIVFFLLVFSVNNLFADDWVKIVDLEGRWKFNIGDDAEWSKYNFNDKNWDEIRVPASWEDEGYNNYNGYAWYRTKFDFPSDIKNGSIYLILGHIDDVDEVYLNGKLVGSTGSFPPNYQTAYNANRKYPIPVNNFFTHKENILAVKVYDSRLNGGIVSGDISIMMLETLNLEVNLEGLWKFKLGDDLSWKESDLTDTDWEEISVPSLWKVSGYKDYDGYAWYRTKFKVHPSLSYEKLVLLLGKIDDIDECYVNGKLIGSTGDFKTTPKTNWFQDEYLELRGYYIPKGILRFDKENTIAVRVYDGYLDGGIYQGPIGIATQDEYRSYWEDKKKKRSLWDIFFNN
jgi:sialate O-acetylesterase